MTDKLYAFIDYRDDYVQPILLAVLRELVSPATLVLIRDDTKVPKDKSLLIWRQYEDIDFERSMQEPRSCIINSYVIRKALIRKHFLSTTVAHWLSKNPQSAIRQHIQPAVEFEVDYAEFLDDALIEAYELHDTWAANQDKPPEDRQWWILKPGMSERGQGIRLFSSEAELTEIFEGWDPDSDDDAEDSDTASAAHSNGVTTSHLRHFIAQPYINPPLLLPQPHPSSSRKFHIRTYALAVGALKVFVYKPMLALFASQAYAAPSDSPNDNLSIHLTNTCLQSGERDGSVHAFWSLPTTLDSLPSDIKASWQQHVCDQICTTTSEVFEAAARTSSIHFQPLPNAFEIFGLDYLVDAQGCAWLLEINAFPDFAQTGDELRGIVSGLMRGVVRQAVLPFFGLPGGSTEDMVQVLDIDLGKG